MEMYSVIDKLYGGLDVQAGGLLNIILETVGFHFPEQKIGYPCMGKKLMFFSVLWLTE